MDHLPEIEDPAYRSPKIECLCSVDHYDGQGILGFPERVGWKIDRRKGPVRINDTKSVLESPSSLMQAWLFFGMLFDVLRIGNSHEDVYAFQQQNSEGCFITTVPLAARLDRMKKRAKDLPLEEFKHRQDQVRQCMSVVNNVFGVHGEGHLDSEAWSISSVLPLDHILAILVLGETLTKAAIQIWPVEYHMSPLRFVAFLQRKNPLETRLLQSNWCPNDVSMLTTSLDNTGVWLASTLRRSFSSTLDHSSCSSAQCFALQIKDDDYRTIHTDACAATESCRIISIDQEKVCAILHSGGTPIVYLPSGADYENRPKVRIFDYNANTLEYIAISHVWAHGLGNPRDNALPECQLLRLKRISSVVASGSKAHLKPTAFWIDTLCIPVNPQYKESRKLAITKLASTFRRARKVLVLDADLQRASLSCSRTELATRILCSGWIRRLWTLQEAVMSDEAPDCSKIDAQFLEGPFEFNAIAGKSVKTLHHTNLAMSVVYSSFPQYQPQNRLYAFLARALEYRSTSRTEDEALCLASILGLGVDAIAGAKTADERMHLMYTCIGELPASVLFHRSKRMGPTGFSWAPASLLGNKKHYNFSRRAGTATCDEQGLHIKVAGYVVTPCESNSQKSSGDVQWSFYIGNREETEPKIWIKSLDEDIVYMSGQTTWDTSIHGSLGLDQLMRKTAVLAFALNPEDMGESALLSVTEEKDGVIFAKFVTKVYIGKPRMGRGVHDEWRKNLISAREVSSQQQWCIS